jgi:hypothetical protein
MFLEIRKKLDELNRLDTKRSIFDASRHQYNLNPPLAPERVVEIEQAIGISLPEQYRKFVIEFANGGAGPDHGIHPLERVVNPKLVSRKVLESIARPFPVPRDVDAMRELGWLPPGTLEVAEIGCGGAYHLVLSGADRGYVWVVNPDGDWSPELSDESHLQGDTIESYLDAAINSPNALKLEFIDWYVKWLDDSLRQVKSQKNS